MTLLPKWQRMGNRNLALINLLWQVAQRNPSTTNFLDVCIALKARRAVLITIVGSTQLEL